MLHEMVYLRTDDPDIRLQTYVSPLTHPAPAMLILPGGAYGRISPRESEPVAKAFGASGFQSFVLYYSLDEKAAFPRPLVDVSLAILHIRENAEKYHVDPNRIFVVGFSAGGHLAASIATLWHKDFARPDPSMPYAANRPTGVILGYPLISSGEYGHESCFHTIVGSQTPTEEQLAAYSLELQVDENTVPAYIWHTTTDDVVPVQNSLLYAMALAKYKIPYEMHIFPQGPHGLSLATQETFEGFPELIRPEVQQWVAEVVDWSKRV